MRTGGLSKFIHESSLERLLLHSLKDCHRGREYLTHILYKAHEILWSAPSKPDGTDTHTLLTSCLRVICLVWPESEIINIQMVLCRKQNRTYIQFAELCQGVISEYKSQEWPLSTSSVPPLLPQNHFAYKYKLKRGHILSPK